MRLDAWLQQQGWSVKQLADAIGLSHEGARLLVRGERNPSWPVMTKVEEVTAGAVCPADFRPEQPTAEVA